LSEAKPLLLVQLFAKDARTTLPEHAIKKKSSFLNVMAKDL